MPSHHPDETLLAELASGTCGELAGVVLASHVSLCSECAGATRELEAVGGALLDSLPASPLAEGALERALAKLDGEGPAPSAVVPVADAVFPAPLRAFLGFGAHETPWRDVTSALSVYRPECGAGADSGQVRLMRIRAGQAMPVHDHGGRELTLVLQGGFSDHAGHYRRGDFATMVPGMEHAPVADRDGDCICLALNEGGVRLRGLVGRILAPLLRF